MTTVHHVKSAARDYPEAGIMKGQSYYWYKKRFGPIVRSLQEPKASQMTGSAYLGVIYSLNEMDRPDDPEGMESFIEDAKSQLEELLEETQNSLENMPEGLQESSSSGQLLQERIDALEDAISTLEGIDIPTREGAEEEIGTLEDALEEERTNVAHQKEEGLIPGDNILSPEEEEEVRQDHEEAVEEELANLLSFAWEEAQEAIGGCAL